MVGITEQSTTRRCSIPRTFSSLPTASYSRGPMARSCCIPSNKILWHGRYDRTVMALVGWHTEARRVRPLGCRR